MEGFLSELYLEVEMPLKWKCSFEETCAIVLSRNSTFLCKSYVFGGGENLKEAESGRSFRCKLRFEVELPFCAKVKVHNY